MYYLVNIYYLYIIYIILYDHIIYKYIYNPYGVRVSAMYKRCTECVSHF